jgi:site-specific DNA recombinase
VPDSDGVACVIYAAKSTEDRRGSIPGQLADCRAAIAALPARSVVAEYTDEAFSAFRRNRGPGLAEAMAHAEELAEQGGLAELWVQHSDRLARGDGHAARHTVEIALWALKRDVKIRTLQDLDTFRDLLYAVVTGERNNEDSRRKALAAQAGRKRALARGEFIGHLPDGYRVVVDVDERNQVTKRMVRDPERAPLIELIFRLALRGRTSGQIAASVNNAGWLTKPTARGSSPRPFEIERIYEVLKNPRYAALATWQGEVIARGRWPAYISERQHERIKRRLASARPGHSRRPLDNYLLAGLVRCGACGGPLIARTWRRDDGDRHRSYLCASYAPRSGSCARSTATSRPELPTRSTH